jgi:hypothetical protein
LGSPADEDHPQKMDFICLISPAPGAYLLAAPAVPDETREVAIEKAKAGEQITVSEAKPRS